MLTPRIVVGEGHGGARESAGRPKETRGERRTCSLELTVEQSTMIDKWARAGSTHESRCSRSQVVRAILDEICAPGQEAVREAIDRAMVAAAAARRRSVAKRRGERRKAAT